MLGDIAAVEEKAVCREENEDGLVPGNIAEDGANASELAMETINKTTAIMICCERPIFDMILTVTPRLSCTPTIKIPPNHNLYAVTRV